MIEIKEIKEGVCKLFGPEGYVGEIKSELSLLDVRVQIKRLGTPGYYIMHENNVYPIYINGKMEMYPPGLYTDFENLLYELI